MASFLVFMFNYLSHNSILATSCKEIFFSGGLMLMDPTSLISLPVRSEIISLNAVPHIRPWHIVKI